MSTLNKISVDNVVYDIGGNNSYSVYGWDGQPSSQTTENLQLFQKILDDHLAGKNILIVRNMADSTRWRPEIYVFDSAATPTVLESNSSYTLFAYPNLEKWFSPGYTEVRENFKPVIITTTAVDPTVVTNVAIGTSSSSWTILEVNRSYSTPFIPTKDDQPATKKYVDDSIPTKTSQLTNDSDYTTLDSVENNYADGTTICGWSSSATDGENMTSQYGMTPSEAASIMAGKKYEWQSRVSFSGMNYAVCYYASHDHGTADDGTSYNYVSAKIGNGTDWISFCWDSSTVYFGATWPGSSGGRACFAGDTLVWTPEGEKKIKDIQIGDRVMSINIEKDIIEPREITKLVNHKEEEILVITTKDGTIKVTGSHPFYEKKKGKVNARTLEVGDELMDDKFGLHKITKIETKAFNDTVYEIVVDGTHNYFIGKKHIRVFNEPSVLKD